MITKAQSHWGILRVSIANAPLSYVFSRTAEGCILGHEPSGSCSWPDWAGWALAAEQSPQAGEVTDPALLW